MALQRRLVALQQLIVDIDNRLDALEQHSPSRDRLDVFVSKQDTAPDCQLNDLGSVPRVQASAIVHTLSLLRS